MYGIEKHIIYLFLDNFVTFCPKTIKPGDILNVWFEISHVNVLFSDFIQQNKFGNIFGIFFSSVNSINCTIFGKICQTFNVTKLKLK
jgi:hypothetical protein